MIKMKLNKINMLELNKNISNSVLLGGKYILVESSKIAPLDTGKLINSGYARKISDRNNITTIKIGYTAKYSGYLHENPQLNFQNNREGKYLSSIIDDRKKQEQLFNIIGQNIIRYIY